MEPDLVTLKERGVYTIRFNRPTKKNALNAEMFLKFQSILHEVSTDDSVSIVVVTGTGDYFTSGNDLSNFMKMGGDIGDMNFDTLAKKGRDGFHSFVKTLIDFPKILVAIVNGPSVGIGVTMLGLFDLVFASSRADFMAPFASLGQSPEGCSSYIFPKLMGYGKATELLVFGRKINASEAYMCGLVTEVLPHDDLHKIWPRIYKYADMDSRAVATCKNTIRHNEREFLHKVNDDECDTLQKCWTSEEFFTAITKFFNRSSKL